MARTSHDAIPDPAPGEGPPGNMRMSSKIGPSSTVGLQRLNVSLLA